MSNNRKLIIIMHFNTHCIPESIEDKMEDGDPVVSPIVFYYSNDNVISDKSCLVVSLKICKIYLKS